MNWRILFQLGLLGLLCHLMTGCVTSALWEDGRFVRFHEPAIPTDLKLFESIAKDDILVQYNEWMDVNEKVRTRSYWLERYREPFSNPHRPNFVSARTANAADDLLPIPILDAAPPYAQTNTGLVAVFVRNPPGFKLYSDGRELGEHVLPVYDDNTATAKKVLLTPVAVTIDAGLFAGYLYLLYWSGHSCGAYDP